MSAMRRFFQTETKATKSARERADATERERELGAFITDHESKATETATLRLTNKVLLVTNGVTAACLALMTLVVGEMLPLQRYYPVFLTFSDKAEQMVRVVPPTANLPSMLIVAENMVRQYIKFRYTVADPRETKDRWNQDMRLFSTNQVYSDFLAETKPIQALMDNGKFARQVIITNIRPRPLEPGLFTVEFDTVDHTDTGVLNTEKVDDVRHWISEMRIAMNPTAVPRSQAARNPFGFIVGAYTVSAKTN